MSDLTPCRLRQHVLVTATVLALSSIFVSTAAARQNPNLTALQSGEYDGFLVKYRQDTLARQQRGASLQKSLDTSVRQAGVSGLALKPQRQIATGAEWVTPSRKLDPIQAAQLMRAFRLDPNVEYVAPNRIAYATPFSSKTGATFLKPNDPQYAQQWGLNPTAGVNAERAWDITRGAGVVVAVVDTGITTHSDLAANLVPGYDFITGGNSGDGGGRDDDPTDKGGTGAYHGTHVSGIAAAVGNNAKGVAGVAYEAKILTVRALGLNASGTWADIFDGMIWAAGGDVTGVPKNANPAEVLNLSLSATGADPCDPSTKDVIDQVHALGATIVVAAGNSGADVAKETPANCETVITAGAVSSSGARAGYSAWGTFVDVGAPGSSVLSANWSSSGENYAEKSGTSMASPHVAGVVALMQAAVSKPLTPAQVQQALKAGARKYTTPPDKPIGVGYADAAGAIAEACKLVGCGATGEPVAKFEYKVDGLKVNFTDQSTDDGKIVKWDWKFGDGSSSSQASPVHAYAAAGKYTVVLTVTDDTGKTGTTKQEVSVTATGEAPKSAFEFKVDGREVNFTDLSTDADGKIVKWEWKFGDNSTSTKASPLHVYAADGNYTVVLTVTDDSGKTGTSEQKVQVGASGGIDAKFEFKADGLEVNFTDLSTSKGKIVKWDWKFGDGSTSTNPSPIHKYGSAGNYTVILTVTDDSGKSDTDQQVVKVEGAGGKAPEAGFEFKVDGFEVNFNDTSTDDGKIVAWSWDFGDGDTSKSPNPLKKYGQKGVYKVRLTVTDNDGQSGTAEQSVTVGSGTDQPPVPSFEFKVDGASVNFNDTSTDPDGKIVAWKWSFGDGASSNTASPLHEYKANGNYKVVLVVTDNGGNSATVERNVQITGLDTAPIAGFTFKATDLQVSFTDSSTDDKKVVAWNWDFGDGTTSDKQNPVHTYSKAGDFTVLLTVRDEAGQKGEVKQIVKVTASADGVLHNGKTVKVSDGFDSRRYFRIDVPAGATKLQFSTSGGTGDVDLYVKFGAKPTPESYDCRPYLKGNAESCPMPEAKAGTWWVMLDGYRAYADVSLTARFEAASDLKTYSSGAAVPIVDLSAVESPIAVSGRDGAKGQAETRLGLAITHSYIGDLRVSLVAPSGKEFVLHNREGGSSDNIYKTYTLDLSGESLNGNWKLRVDDNSQGDSGSINVWSITF